MTYKFSYRKRYFWKKIIAVGHNYLPESNRMDIYQKDGSIFSIGEWSKCDLKLGTDFVLFTKKQMEEESGQEIKLKSNIEA